MIKLIAGNWKMNGLREDAQRFGAALAQHVAGRTPPCDMVICPPAPLIGTLRAALAGLPVGVGGQDCHAAVKGPHTGDVAAVMLADFGCSHVIVGHSERRAAYGETDALVAAKATAALAAGLVPIICVGESGDERAGGLTLDVVARQLAGSVPEDAVPARCVVAYEPIWAIGSGATPTEAEIAAVHAELRGRLIHRFGPAGRALRLLYGGSAKPGNAAALVGIPEVDGLLVGGASLVADDYWAICASCR